MKFSDDRFSKTVLPFILEFVLKVHTIIIRYGARTKLQTIKRNTKLISRFNIISLFSNLDY